MSRVEIAAGKDEPFPERLLCACGNGFMSRVDKKCGHCRTAREKKEREEYFRKQWHERNTEPERKRKEFYLNRTTSNWSNTCP